METNRKGSGGFMLQERAAKALIGTVSYGSQEGNEYLYLVFIPQADVFSISPDGVLTIHRDIAMDVIGIVHVLLAASEFLGATPTDVSRGRATRLVTFGTRTPRGIVRVQFERGAILDTKRDDDGIISLELNLQAAADLAGALSHELGRIAAWLPVDD